MIQTRELLREAWRNTDAGVTRPLVSAVLFAILVGGFSITQVMGVVQIGKDAQAWRSAGASIQVVNYPQGIDGAGCDALRNVTGVVAAGAVRRGDDVTLAALPSNTFQTFEATPGLALVLRAVSTDASIPPGNAPGVWLSGDLAEVLGITRGHTHQLPVMTENGTADGELTVGAIYSYPDDGRQPLLVYNMIMPVPADGVFDACWVEVWPEDSALDRLIITSTIITTQDAAGDPPRVRQLNTTLGATFDAQGRLASLPRWTLDIGGLLTGVAMGWLLVWSRRLELASTLHAGVDKTSLVMQLLAETLFWVVPAAAVVAASGYYVATWNNPDPPWPALAPGLGVCGIGLAATLVTTVVVGFILSERQLFRFFKTR